MKGITLWQPWASLIAEGVKSIETRPKRSPWSSVVGETIAIHAAKRDPVVTLAARTWFEGEWYMEHPGRDTFDAIPLGAVVAICRLVDVVPIGAHPNLGWRHDDGRFWNLVPQLPFGNYEAGRWALLLDNIVKTVPVPCRGYQGLWTLPPEIADNLLTARGVVA